VARPGKISTPSIADAEIELEALEAARELGFDVESKPGLLAALKGELAFWYIEK
jgi:hypothetical protein